MVSPNYKEVTFPCKTLQDPGDLTAQNDREHLQQILRRQTATFFYEILRHPKIELWKKNISVYMRAYHRIKRGSGISLIKAISTVPQRRFPGL